MPALYRKYRPQTFADLIGQEHIATTIANEIIIERLSHAYLFSGPRGIGKTTLARLLAKAANCQKRKKGAAEPCNECGSCLEITAGRNIDVFEMDAASHTQVEKVRENIIENINLKPTSSKYKIFIIDEVHMLSPSSFNALLKTLEEPPAHALFILATTELNKLPDTIVSRCQRFNFKKIPLELIVAKLKKIAGEEEVKVDKEVLELVAVKSGGCLRDAESLFGQILSLNLKRITLEAVQNVLPSAQLDEAFEFIKNAIADDTAKMISAVQTLSQNGINPEIFAEDILQILRLSLIAQTGFQPTETALLTKAQIADLKQVAQASTAPQLIAAIDKTTLRGNETRSAVLPQLPLEMLAIELVQIFNSNAANSSANNGLAERPVSAKTAPQSAPVAEERQSPAVIPAKGVALGDQSPPVIPTEAEGRAEESLKPKLSPSPTITLDLATEFWNKMIETVSASNPSLTFILKMASVEKIDDQALVINIPYSFHKDKLEEPKSKKVILDALTAAGSAGLILHYTVKTEVATEDSSAQSLALQFGGEVIG